MGWETPGVLKVKLAGCIRLYTYDVMCEWLVKDTKFEVPGHYGRCDRLLAKHLTIVEPIHNIQHSKLSAETLTHGENPLAICKTIKSLEHATL